VDVVVSSLARMAIDFMTVQAMSAEDRLEACYNA
jgi:hypothetical protein